MIANQGDIDRPIRVVVFTSGPLLERGVKQFLSLLEDHPQIELLVCVGQARQSSLTEVWISLWKRRGVLAAPILLSKWMGDAWRFIRYPRRELTLGKKINRLAGRIQFVRDIHAPEVLTMIHEMTPDLGLIYGSPILKPSLFEIPLHGTLGIHHGKVPEYRGKKTMFWAMYQDEQVAGVTIQKVNRGLDTGQIVKQAVVPIGNRFPGQVWEDLNECGLSLYIQAVLEVKLGKASFQSQNGKEGNVYRDPSPKDVAMLWVRILRRKMSDWLNFR
jgi:folate-dependent phosphoribosylglycinamide formyltransferase PurN